MLDSIEEQLIRSEGIYYYSKVSSIEETIDKNTQGQIERIRNKIHQEINILTVEIDSLPDYPTISDFAFAFACSLVLGVGIGIVVFSNVNCH